MLSLYNFKYLELIKILQDYLRQKKYYITSDITSTSLNAVQLKLEQLFIDYLLI